VGVVTCLQEIVKKCCIMAGKKNLNLQTETNIDCVFFLTKLTSVQNLQNRSSLGNLRLLYLLRSIFKQ
jgi:hypothetical protein